MTANVDSIIFTVEVPHLKNKPNATAFEVYYYRSHDKWAELIPYHPIIAFYVFISNKLALYAWNFMDLIITIFARALYFKFKALYTQGELIILSGNNSEYGKETKKTFLLKSTQFTS